MLLTIALEWPIQHKGANGKMAIRGLDMLTTNGHSENNANYHALQKRL